ncbi:MAG: KpsF/GutQ family sugar-phosphate isomerase [Candidatus Omnitrophica bacterium]|nr:KpsF/GutQ family sugar-phosphate isomerase [Candidatus Omnitrophota bacterium]
MYTKEAKRVLNIESQAIKDLAKRLDKNFDRAIQILARCKGRVVFTGMGKAGIIAQKISATMSSTGTPSLFLHSAEAIHGDLGRVTKDDVVVALSNSGETEEVKKLLPLIKKMGAKLISFTGNTKSTLAKYSDAVFDVSVKKEACPLGLAPTSSTTAMLAMGDALCVCLLKVKKFREEDFAFYHSGGSLGRRLLLKVEDIMRKGAANPIVGENKLVKEVLYAITNARAGAASIINKKGKLIGIFTDGDLRRHLDGGSNLPRLKIKDVMTKDPITVNKEQLAAEALRILQEKKIDEVPVVDKSYRPVGMLDVQDLLKAGLV